jgi:hypothetical protein
LKSFAHSPLQTSHLWLLFDIHSNIRCTDFHVEEEQIVEDEIVRVSKMVSLNINTEMIVELSKQTLVLVHVVNPV